MTRYEMIGAQAITLEDGSRVEPGAGEFEVDLSHPREKFYLEIGALRRVERAEPSEPLQFVRKVKG